MDNLRYTVIIVLCLKDRPQMLHYKSGIMNFINLINIAYQKMFTIYFINFWLILINLFLEEHSLLGCNVVYFTDSPTFWRKMTPSSLGLKSKPRKIPPEAECNLAICFCWLTLWPWWWKLHVPLKCPALSQLHSVTSQKTIYSFKSLPREPQIQ
jgi:hypothetical protein